jgi:hypothetical protein
MIPSQVVMRLSCARKEVTLPSVEAWEDYGKLKNVHCEFVKFYIYLWSVTD